MYQIYADDTLIYDSTVEDYKIGKGLVTLEVGKSGSFVFSVYPDHFYYNRFSRLKTIIIVYKSGKIIFRGRILSDVTDHWNNKVITCEGELGFLQDSIVRPFKYTNYPSNLLTQWIHDHNSQVDESKHFYITDIMTDPDDPIEYSDEEYKTTLTSITDHLIGKSGGYLHITHGADGTDPMPHIQYLKDFEKVSTQSIEFGSNLRNYTKTVKANDIFTAIIPLGAEIEVANNGDENSSNEDENSSNEDETVNTRLTIAGVNDGLDYIYNASGVALYGWIFKVVTWDDITDEFELKRVAEKTLTDNLGQKNTIELNAVDLHLLDPTIESINIGEYVRAVSTPHDMYLTLLCSKQTIDLLKPENDSYTLGHTYTTMSDLASNVSKNVESYYELNRRLTNAFGKTSSLIEQTEEKIRLEVVSNYAKKSELELTVKRNENDQIVSMINASANAISLTADRFTLESEDITIKNGRITSESKAYSDFQGQQVLRYTRTLSIDRKGIEIARIEGTSLDSGYMYKAALRDGFVQISNPSYFDGTIPIMLICSGDTPQYVLCFNPSTMSVTAKNYDASEEDYH